MFSHLLNPEDFVLQDGKGSLFKWDRKKLYTEYGVLASIRTRNGRKLAICGPDEDTIRKCVDAAQNLAYQNYIDKKHEHIWGKKPLRGMRARS